MKEVQLSGIPSQTLLGVNTCESTHAQQQLTQKTTCVFTCPRHPYNFSLVLSKCISPHLMLMDGFLLLPFAPWPQGTGWFKVWVLLATDSRAPDLGCPVCSYLFPLECLVLPQGEMCRACLITLWHHGDWRWIFFPLLRRKLRDNQAVREPRKWSGLSVGTHNYSWKDWICTLYFA